MISVAIESLSFNPSQHIGHLKLCRSERGNALNIEILEALSHELQSLSQNLAIQAIVLSGEGKYFCTGADIQNFIGSTSKKKKFATIFSHLLKQMFEYPKIITTLLNGDCWGGGLGLIACSDWVVATPDLRFTFSEAKLGVIPSLIGPYIMHQCNPSFTKAYFLTAQPFTAQAAQSAGLIHHITSDPSKGLSDIQGWLKNLAAAPSHICKSMKAYLQKQHPISKRQLQHAESTFLTMLDHPDTKATLHLFLNKQK